MAPPFLEVFQARQPALALASARQPKSPFLPKKMLRLNKKQPKYSFPSFIKALRSLLSACSQDSSGHKQPNHPPTTKCQGAAAFGGRSETSQSLVQAEGKAILVQEEPKPPAFHFSKCLIWGVKQKNQIPFPFPKRFPWEAP